jgi:hypothetical protein
VVKRIISKEDFFVYICEKSGLVLQKRQKIEGDYLIKKYPPQSRVEEV